MEKFIAQNTKSCKLIFRISHPVLRVVLRDMRECRQVCYTLVLWETAGQEYDFNAHLQNEEP